MDRIDELLKLVQRTNRAMNKEKLIEEILKCRYSVIGLSVVLQNR